MCSKLLLKEYEIAYRVMRNSKKALEAGEYTCGLPRDLSPHIKLATKDLNKAICSAKGKVAINDNLCKQRPGLEMITAYRLISSDH